MINIKVRLFAALKEIIGKNHLDLQFNGDPSLKDVISFIIEAYPSVKEIIKISKYAVNMEYTDINDGKHLNNGDEITIIMPVSGGTYNILEDKACVEITEEKIDSNKVLDFVSDPLAGSVLLFNGTVRNNDDGKPVEYLYYEAYEEMAVKEINKLIADAFSKYNIIKICIVHRTGKINTGEVSITIGISSPHREDSYMASKFLIDNIKETVPIWKKEAFEDGSRWKRL